jgi:uncharacterized protein (TIGR02246 family)
MTLPPSGFAKLLLVLAITLLLSGAGLSAQSNADAGLEKNRDAEAIDKLSQKDIAACLKDDVDTLCSLWTDDGVLLMPDVPPLVGKKAICGMLQEQKANAHGSKTTGYTEDWDEVRIVDDYAWQWGRMSQTQTNASGQQETMRVSAIRILHRQPDGSWKVSRAMVSPATQ